MFLKRTGARGGRACSVTAKRLENAHSYRSGLHSRGPFGCLVVAGEVTEYNTAAREYVTGRVTAVFSTRPAAGMPRKRAQRWNPKQLHRRAFPVPTAHTVVCPVVTSPAANASLIQQVITSLTSRGGYGRGDSIAAVHDHLLTDGSGRLALIISPRYEESELSRVLATISRPCPVGWDPVVSREFTVPGASQADAHAIADEIDSLWCSFVAHPAAATFRTPAPHPQEVTTAPDEGEVSYRLDLMESPGSPVTFKHHGSVTRTNQNTTRALDDAGVMVRHVGDLTLQDDGYAALVLCRDVTEHDEILARYLARAVNTRLEAVRERGGGVESCGVGAGRLWRAECSYRGGERLERFALDEAVGRGVPGLVTRVGVSHPCEEGEFFTWEREAGPFVVVWEAGSGRPPFIEAPFDFGLDEIPDLIGHLEVLRAEFESSLIM